MIVQTSEPWVLSCWQRLDLDNVCIDTLELFRSIHVLHRHVLRPHQEDCSLHCTDTWHVLPTWFCHRWHELLRWEDQVHFHSQQTCKWLGPQTTDHYLDIPKLDLEWEQSFIYKKARLVFLANLNRVVDRVNSDALSIVQHKSVSWYLQFNSITFSSKETKRTNCNIQ